MKSKCLGLLIIYSLILAASLHAQDTRPLTLEADDLRIQLEVPAAWQDMPDSAANTAEARSTVTPIQTDFQHMVLSVEELAAPFGELSSDDPIGKYMELLQASLPINGEFQPEHFSEVGRFRWQTYSAAVFIAYADAGYYSRWFGIMLDEKRVLLIRQGTSGVPTQDTLSLFDKSLGTLSINGEMLDATGARQILGRLDDPLAKREAMVAALRVEDAEVRIAAPPDWFQRDVSRNYPSQYFFQQDPYNLEEGDSIGGAVIQISLFDREDMLAKLDLDELPPPRERAVAYINTLLASAPPELIVSPPQEWDISENLYAVLLPTEYPDSIALHSGGTFQQTLLVEVHDSLLLVTLYAPVNDREAVLPVWKNILSSLMINGESLEIIVSEME